MTHATWLWSIWQTLLKPFAWVFTRLGHRRFVEWITAMALNVEEHTITQSVLSLDRPADWKAMKTFAETGAWPTDAVARTLARLVEKAPAGSGTALTPRPSMTPRSIAPGSTSGAPVPYHEYTAHCPNQATTVRAHNWVILGASLDNHEQPAWFLPLSGRLSLRKSQWPAQSGFTGATVAFRALCELAVDLLWEQARTLGGRHLGVFDGGFALKSVVRPLVVPEDGSPRIEFLTRLRHDARLHAPLPHRHRANQKCGKKLAPPARAGGGADRGTKGKPSSTGGGGSSAGRKSCACGGSWGMTCR
ncbi:MAG: hypothetical protein JO344_19125 [Planctomycetaceae bacterium]|nr:hypothetical protein [Planctomycetaceae bacterium]